MLNRTTTTYDSLGPDMKRSHLKAKRLPGTNIIGAPQKQATLTKFMGAPKKQATLTKFMGAPLLKYLAAFCVLDNVLGAVAPSKTPAVLCSDECLADSSVPVRESSQLQNLKP